jgi:hypothetical protein
MDGVQRLLVGIDYEDFTQVTAPFAPGGASAYAGNVFLDLVIRWFRM